MKEVLIVSPNRSSGSSGGSDEQPGGALTRPSQLTQADPEQLAALLQQNANTTPNPAALAAVGANTNEEELREKISE